MTSPRTAILVRESANRVYSGDAQRLLAAELAAVAPHLDGPVPNIEPATIGGVDYVMFDGDELGDLDRFVISNLSCCRAVFRVDGDGRLRPVDLMPLAFFDDDLITTQRYPGKTNEQFTHLLVNVGVAASRAAHERAAQHRPVRVLDPVAGRGSSLNRALVHGFDATGIEVAEADVDQYKAFLTTYLKTHRLKHRVERERVKKGPLAGTWRFGVSIAGHHGATMVRGETDRAAELLSGQTFDAVVGDLPYGVQHRAAGGATRRSPGELVADAIDGWVSLMRRGASLTLSYNTRTLPTDELRGLVVAAGLVVVDHPHPFTHTVDRSIERDVLVAAKDGAVASPG